MISKKHAFLATAAFVATVGFATVAAASPVVIVGNYVKAGVSDAGTLGSDGSTSPGILHDPTGTQNFGINDYLTPGSPHDGFSINSTQTGFLSNDNNNVGAGAFTGAGPTLLSGAALLGYTTGATWTGTDKGVATITNNYYLNANDERIVVVTTITALENLSNVAFARSIDPDPDVNTYGVFDTNNQRGNGVYGVTDFVGGAGAHTGLTIGLLNLSGNTYAHNTAIDSSCCSNINPYTVLTGYSAGPFGDYGLNMAWNIGNLASGASATISYAYVMGTNITTVGGGTGGVPEPATWGLMLVGFGGLGAMLRRRRATLAMAAA